MNGAQRILNTLEGRPVDRCATTAILSLYGAKLSGSPLDTYYRDPSAYAHGQCAVMEVFAPDILFGPFDFPSIGEAFGSEVRHFAEQAPNLRRPAISSYLEWDRLCFPDPEAHPRMRFCTEAIHQMAVRAAAQTIIAACLPPVIDLPAMILGIDGWMEAIVSDRAAATSIMRSLLSWHRRVARSLYAAGASVIAMPCAFASPAIVTKEIAQILMRPVLAESLADIGGLVVLHHGGAPLQAHLDVLCGLPSMTAVFLDEKDDLRHARSILGPGPVLLHGPQAPRLPRLSAAQVEASCRKSIAENGGPQRLILGNSGPDVPWSTPAENIHAIRRAAESAAREASP